MAAKDSKELTVEQLTAKVAALEAENERLKQWMPEEPTIRVTSGLIAICDAKHLFDAKAATGYSTLKDLKERLPHVNFPGEGAQVGAVVFVKSLARSFTVKVDCEKIIVNQLS